MNQPHIDMDRLAEIHNDHTLTDDEKHKLAYREMWGMSFAQDLGGRIAFCVVLIVLLIGGRLLLGTL